MSIEPTFCYHPTVPQTDIQKKLDLFKPNNFFPLKYFSNTHIQSIFGSGFFTAKIIGHPPRDFVIREERVHTDDGDFYDIEFTGDLALHYKDDEKDAENGPLKPIIIVVHGLEGSMRASQITYFTQAYRARGFECILYSFRGCNFCENNNVGGYHFGFTKDLKHLIAKVHNLYPTRDLYLSGYSLGGNVILKSLSEIGDDSPKFNLKGAVVSCVPMDPINSKAKLDNNWFYRFVYVQNFLRTMKIKAQRQFDRFPGIFDIKEVLKANTIEEYDTAYVSKIYNYDTAMDYYKDVGSRWRLKDIKVPCFVINAIDDPFICECSLPTDEDIGSAPIRLIYQKQGGHCGFWTNTLDGENPLPRHGWLSEEMSRCIIHLREHF